MSYKLPSERPTAPVDPKPKERRPECLDDPTWREAALLMIAFGRARLDEIAKAMNVDLTVIQELRRDPSAQSAIAATRRILSRARNATDLLAEDAERNILFLSQLRDGIVDGHVLDPLDPKFIRERREAAKILVERQVPKRIAVTGGLDARAPIDITPAQEEHMRKMLEAFPESPSAPAAPEPSR
jgi:hypothetical protein